MAEQSTGTDSGGRKDRGAQLLAERREGRFVTLSTRVLGAVITVIALTWAIEFWLRLGFQWFDEQALVACFGLTLAIVFIRFPFARRAGPAVGSLVRRGIRRARRRGASAYLIWIYGDIELNPFAMRGKMFWISAVLIPLMWEALRRTAGWSLTIVLSVFLAYAFVGHLAPGMLKGYEQDGYRMIAELGVTNVALLGLPLKIIVLTVVLFIWMGQLLLHTGASEWFTDLAAAVMGRSRGGSAKIAVVASGLFGSISGSAVSNVASTGVITIPLMRNAGYDRKSAGAIEAVASTGGQIMPPIMGAAAFLMAELLELEYTEIILAALIPSVLYYLAVFVQVDLEAAKNDIAPLPKDRIPPILRVLKEGWFFALPYVVLVYALFTLNLPAQEAAFWAAISVAVVSIVFGYKRRRISPAPALGLGRRLRPRLGRHRGHRRDGRHHHRHPRPHRTRPGSDADPGGGRRGQPVPPADSDRDRLDPARHGDADLGDLPPAGDDDRAVADKARHPSHRGAHVRALFRADVDDYPARCDRRLRGGIVIGGPADGDRGDGGPSRLDRLCHPLRVRAFPGADRPGQTALEIISAGATAMIGVWIASCGLIGFMFGRLGIAERLLTFAAGILLLLPAHADRLRGLAQRDRARARCADRGQGLSRAPAGDAQGDAIGAPP